MTAELHTVLHLHHERVHRFGLRVCRDEADADDAVQEAFAKLSRRPDVLRHQGALSWLMTVVRRACLRLLRPFVREQRAWGQRLQDPPELPAQEPDPQQAFEREERVKAVHAALASLPPIYREVLVLRELEGLSGEETCEILGIELAAMKSRLHRARAQLKAELLRAE
jgi:RNA polymerase sigma-70 factor (ECF subfamily)